jgi:hypothetical protein
VDGIERITECGERNAILIANVPIGNAIPIFIRFNKVYAFLLSMEWDKNSSKENELLAKEINSVLVYFHIACAKDDDSPRPEITSETVGPALFWGLQPECEAAIRTFRDGNKLLNVTSVPICSTHP